MRTSLAPSGAEGAPGRQVIIWGGDATPQASPGESDRYPGLYLQVAQGGLDGTPDEALVGLPRRYVPLGDRGVLIHQPCHSGARLGRAALGRFLEKPAQLDLRLQLVLDRGPKADLLPGKRIDPAVYRHPE